MQNYNLVPMVSLPTRLPKLIGRHGNVKLRDQTIETPKQFTTFGHNFLNALKVINKFEIIAGTFCPHPGRKGLKRKKVIIG